MDKVEIIAKAYAELRISGLTVSPTPEDLNLALDELESMAAEWEEVRVICVGYNFEDVPDPNSESGIQLGFKSAFAKNLALRLSPPFGKTVHPVLQAMASQGLSGLSGATITVREVQYPNRQPVGSGTSLRYNRWERFYRKIPLAPISCETEQISQEEINDYSLDLSSYLVEGETISSYTFEVTNDFRMVQESLSGELWTYRIECDRGAGPFQQVQFNATTSEGRKQVFTINFNVTAVPILEQ